MKTFRSILPLFAAAILACTFTACTDHGGQKPQPVLGSRSVTILEKKGLQFRDLNKNGELDPYEDWRLSDSARIVDLLSQMTLEEKVGLMFHPTIALSFLSPKSLAKL